MEYLDKMLMEALNRYFTVLEKTGYINDADTDRIILLSYLQEFLSEYQYYITEEDYNVINRIIQCLAGQSCLIPYGEFMELSKPLTGYVYSIPIKITEYSVSKSDSDIRHTEINEGEGLRLVDLDKDEQWRPLNIVHS